MTKPPQRLVVLLGALAVLAGGFLAWRNSFAAEPAPGPDTSLDAPDWPVNEPFKKEIFTFARVKYSVDGAHGMGQHGNMRWSIDYPDADRNFAYRLHQVTSIAVNPEIKVVEITDKDLLDYPFLYVVEPGRLTFTEEEVPILRRYLLNGGFIMFDDFWGMREWTNFTAEMTKLFPERAIEDLPLEHPIFHGVFDLKERPQVPHADIAIGNQQFAGDGASLMRRPDMREPHYRAILDDKKRIMVLICHNTDLGDGWEREGENEFYFREYSEKKAYPLGINIIFYAMTH
jgi:hypothetical protein